MPDSNLLTNAPIRLAFMSDSPKKQTGFGTVAKELAQGFHDAGIEVIFYGFLDHDPDDKKILPYHFEPTRILDDLGHANYGKFFRKYRPDVIFFLTDPGNVHIYMHGIMTESQATYRKEGVAYIPPVVAYTPIEGKPSPEAHGQGLKWVEETNGTVVVYCEAARRAIRAQFPRLDPKIVQHGLDHFPAACYSPEDKYILRQLVGLQDKFVVGSIGVNKRTKGFPTLIYTAVCLRDMGEDKDLIFYLHTNPYEDTMWGHKLHELVRYYGVEDMFLFKPDIRRGYWDGVERDNGTLEQARQIAGQVPETAAGRGLLFGNYDFVSRLNCLDLYVDASQIEGWGLPLGEAMACGVPSISVHDFHVRDEIYSRGAYMIDPLPKRMWETWHSSMRLVSIDPQTLADAIVMMRRDDVMRSEFSKLGMEVARHYTWASAKEKMTRIVLDTVNKDRQDFRAYKEKHPGETATA